MRGGPENIRTTSATLLDSAEDIFAVALRDREATATA
jgi:hypothetical protein